MKGIILAGGSGTRLYPLTSVTSKQLLPVYDKPMIYYPLSVLMMADIKEILIITTPRDSESFQNLLGDGSNLGITLKYKVQAGPRGLPEAFILAEEFAQGDDLTLILGDNIFYGDMFIRGHVLPAIKSRVPTIFAYKVRGPERYGIVEFDKDMNVLSIEEKPKRPKSHYAITGLYVFDNEAVEIAKNLKPSARGELEITEVMKSYMGKGKLRVELLGRGVTWLDTGTHEDLLAAANFIEIVAMRQGVRIAALEEVAYRKKYISLEALEKMALSYGKSSYAQSLMDLVEEERKSYYEF